MPDLEHLKREVPTVRDTRDEAPFHTPHDRAAARTQS